MDKPIDLLDETKRGKTIAVIYFDQFMLQSLEFQRLYESHLVYSLCMTILLFFMGFIPI